MKLWLVCALLGGLAGCQAHSGYSRDGHHLRWQFAGGVEHVYDMVYVEVNPDTHREIADSLVSDEPVSRAQIKQILDDLDLPVASYRATVARKDAHIHASVVGIMPGFELPPADWKEEYDRALIESNVGNVVLAGDFSNEGELLSFFLETPQKNLNNLLFSLPSTAVQPGDSWPLDAYGLQLGSGFTAEHATRVSTGYLEGLYRDEQGRQIAEIRYRLREDVDGHFRVRRGEALQDIPIAATYTYVAQAHFLIDEGRWLDYTALGVHTTKDTDVGPIVTAYALRPVKTP